MTKRASKWGAALRHLLLGSPMMMLIAVLIVVALVILGTKAARWMVQNNHLDVATTQQVTLSPTQIRSVERIRQWEFLSVSDEELIDTVRHGFFGDDQLIRIYYGTLRLGVDLAETKEGWLRLEGDTVVALLPAIKLLDEDFIDEARTQSFYETGKWSREDRACLYQRAYRTMRRRCLSRENVASAERNALLQFDNLFHSMGFEHVSVRFAPQP